MKCNVAIKRVTFDKETLTVTMEASVTPELVEEVASLNAKGELQMVLVPVEPSLFDGQVKTASEGAPDAPATGQLVIDLDKLRGADEPTPEGEAASESPFTDEAVPDEPTIEPTDANGNVIEPDQPPQNFPKSKRSTSKRKK